MEQISSGWAGAPRIAFDLVEEPPQGKGALEVVVLRASGEVDFAAGPRLRARLFAHISAGHRRLVLDLSAVTFIDSMAIGVLVGAVMQLQKTGGGVLAAVCSSDNERVLRIFDIAGVASLIMLHHSREAAFEELARNAHRDSRARSESRVDVIARAQEESSTERRDAAQRYGYPGEMESTRSSARGANRSRAHEIDEWA